MKTAVTYENGQIFQHFGHSESFKIYEAEGKNIVRAEIIGTDGAGHSALAAVLKDKGVDVLICGGIGNGAVQHFQKLELVYIQEQMEKQMQQLRHILMAI